MCVKLFYPQIMMILNRSSPSLIITTFLSYVQHTLSPPGLFTAIYYEMYISAHTPYFYTCKRLKDKIKSAVLDTVSIEYDCAYVLSEPSSLISRFCTSSQLQHI